MKYAPLSEKVTLNTDLSAQSLALAALVLARITG
jgi:hypothetical protein